MAHDTPSPAAPPAALKGKTALVTGGARRVGAAIARALHGAGANVVLHYRSSADDAATLERELNAARAASAASRMASSRCCFASADRARWNSVTPSILAQQSCVNNKTMFY